MGNDAAERTEKATGRRRSKERQKGNVSKSQDLTASIMITVGVVLLGFFAKNILSKLQELFYQTFTHLSPESIQTDDIFVILLPFFKATAEIVVPFMVILTVLAIFIVRFQIGHILAVSKLKPNFGALSPGKWPEKLRKLINPVEPKTLVELVKSLLKLVIVATTGFSVLNGRKDELFGLMGLDLPTAFAVMSSVLSQMVINMCIAMLVLGLFDKKYQDYEYEKSIKMTKQEVKDEMKDTEGDPKIKAKVRAVQMQMMRQRMMSAIPTADVVVTNPTHYAVAIKYNKKDAPAPIVVAKGVDFVAFKIREIAQNNNIPIVENKPLAQALYKLVPIDGIIPSDMFVAVAEVLAYVYNSKKR